MSAWIDQLHVRAAGDPALAAVVARLAAGLDAREVAEALAAARDDDAHAWYLLGVAAAEDGAFGVALAACDRCAQLAPDAPEPHFGRGCAFEAMQRDDLAAAAYGDALARDPRFAKAWRNLVLACLRIGDLDSALVAADAALGAGLDDPLLRYKRAEALARLGRGDDAAAELARAIVLDPRIADELGDDEHFAAALAPATLARLTGRR